MTLCMHVATNDALIVCSDGRSCLTNNYRDGFVEFVKSFDDEVKSFFYNDIVISISGSSIYRKEDKKQIYEFNDFFDDLYKSSPEMFNVNQFPSYLVCELWGSGKYEFGRLGCDFLVSGLSSTGEYHIYRVFGEHGEILEVSDIQNYSSVGVKFLANSILSKLIISELSTKSVLEILKFIAKTYCKYGELTFDEMSDSKYFEDYDHINKVGGKWIFYVFDFKTKKKKYVKFCADGKIRYYSKLVQNEFS